MRRQPPHRALGTCGLRQGLLYEPVRQQFLLAGSNVERQGIQGRRHLFRTETAVVREDDASLRETSPANVWSQLVRGSSRRSVKLHKIRTVGTAKCSLRPHDCATGVLWKMRWHPVSTRCCAAVDCCASSPDRQKTTWCARSIRQLESPQSVCVSDCPHNLLLWSAANFRYLTPLRTNPKGPRGYAKVNRHVTTSPQSTAFCNMCTHAC